MSDIGKVALAPPGTQQRIWQERVLRQSRTPETDKEIRKGWEVARATFFTQVDNSSRLEAASTLRHFLSEINTRLFNHGLHSMPASFNVFEAFVEYFPAINVFQMLPEIETKIYFGDYFDYLTSNADIDVVKIASSMSEKQIYSFDALDDFESSVFRISNEIQYAFRSLSYVRRENELSIIARVGIRDTSNQYIVPLDKIRLTKNGLAPSSDLKRELTFDFQDYRKSVVLFRVDLEDSSQNTRYIYRDEGNSFNVVTDDINAFLDSDGNLLEGTKDRLTTWSRETARYQAIFETCLSLMGLEIFVSENSENVVVERIATEYRKNFQKKSYQKLTQLAPPNERKFFRDVGVLGLQGTGVRGRLVVQNPRFRIERDGYWKLLEPEQVGQDKYGKTVSGKTWVVQTLFSYETNETVLEPTEEDINNKAGYIYILRNASHEVNVFKIGLTKRSPDVRSEELSRSTGSPDKFLVAQEWYTKDCKLAESTIHEYFKDYRINERREFFRIDFRTLITVIDEIIKKIGDAKNEKLPF